MNKRCTKCGQEKPLEEFHRLPKGVLGRHSRCRSCGRDDARESMRKLRAKRGSARARWAAIAAAAALAGCTQATVSLPDGTSVQFTRFASEADLILSPDGLHYSSSPSAVAQQNALDLVGQALGVALRGGLPVPRSAPNPSYWPQALRMSEAGL